MKWKCPKCKEVQDHILLSQYALDKCEIEPNEDGTIRENIIEQGKADPQDLVCPNCFVHFDGSEHNEKNIEFIKE